VKSFMNQSAQSIEFEYTGFRANDLERCRPKDIAILVGWETKREYEAEVGRISSSMFWFRVKVKDRSKPA